MKAIDDALTRPERYRLLLGSYYGNIKPEEFVQKIDEIFVRFSRHMEELTGKVRGPTLMQALAYNGLKQDPIYILEVLKTQSSALKFVGNSASNIFMHPIQQIISKEQYTNTKNNLAVQRIRDISEKMGPEGIHYYLAFPAFFGIMKGNQMIITLEKDQEHLRTQLCDHLAAISLSHQMFTSSESLVCPVKNMGFCKKSCNYSCRINKWIKDNEKLKTKIQKCQEDYEYVWLELLNSLDSSYKL